MADDKKVQLNEGWTVLKKGYTPASGGKEEGGYQGPKGELGGPPTSGSAVSKPPVTKKD